MRTPDCRQAVIPGQGGVRVLRHVDEPVIMREESLGKTEEGEAEEEKLPARRVVPEVHPGTTGERNTGERDYCLQDGTGERKCQGKMAVFADHCLTPGGAFFRLSATSGGM